LKGVTDSEIDAAFATLLQLQAGRLIVDTGNRAYIAPLASRHAVPAVALFRDFPDAGGRLSYGSSLTDAYRVKGIYTGKTLKGEKPADLPVQQQSKFELVINLKTAKALGLTVPPSMLDLADEVIE
jgi:putative ABC transport system substrate-binding protein